MAIRNNTEMLLIQSIHSKHTDYFYQQRFYYNLKCRVVGLGVFCFVFGVVIYLIIYLD